MGVPLYGVAVRIGAGSTFVLPVRVENAQVSIEWEFNTEAHSIYFGVVFKNDPSWESNGTSSKQQTIINQQRFEAHKESIRGSHTSTGKGVYLMTWDNSQSAIVAKKITYV